MPDLPMQWEIDRAVVIANDAKIIIQVNRAVKEIKIAYDMMNEHEALEPLLDDLAAATSLLIGVRHAILNLGKH